MGNLGPSPKLLPEKLVLIREHLNLSQTAITRSLNLSKADRVSEFENGKREPSLGVALAYSRLGQVPMASLVDDDISLNTFRMQLGTFHYGTLKTIGKKVSGPKQV